MPRNPRRIQRDPRLRDLSREHHHALVLARRARRAAEGGSVEDAEATWAAIVQAFEAELEPHFAIEERLLLPPLAALGEEAVVSRTLDDHARLRAQIDEAGGEVRDRLAAFAALLRDHVRFEESTLFEVAQTRLGPAELEAVAEASR